MKKGAQLINSASDMLSYFSDLFGLKKEAKKLKGWDDWDVVHDEKSQEPEI